MGSPNERAQRRLTFLKVKIRSGDEWSDLTIVNVSVSGFMAKSSVIPAVGEKVHIQHRGTTIAGDVIWVTRTRFGVRSDGPIDLSALTAEGDLKDRRTVPRAEIKRERWWHWRSGS